MQHIWGVRGRIFRGAVAGALVVVAVAAGHASAATSRRVARPPATKRSATKRSATKAAPAKVCDLVVATAKDQNSADPNLHVLSADVATSGGQLTWVIRVQKLTEGLDTSSPGGLTWQFSFQVGTQRPVNPEVSYSPVFGAFDPSGQATKITLDTATSSIYYTMSLATIASAVGTSIVEGQTVLRNFQVRTYSSITPVTPPEAGGEVIGDSIAYQTPAADVTSPATYVAGTPSCVQVGY